MLLQSKYLFDLKTILIHFFECLAFVVNTFIFNENKLVLKVPIFNFIEKNYIYFDAFLILNIM